MRVRYLFGLGVPLAAVALWSSSGTSHSQTPADEAAKVRCATRLSLSLTGKAPNAALLAAADPQAQIDTLLADPAFVEQFSRFVNSELNPEPAMAPAQDATYFMAKYVLENQKPWHEMFDGKYDVQPVAAANGNPATAQIVADPNGLGYFRSRPWMVRYAGNEEDGYRLSAAFRIQQNIIGLDVGAVTNAPGVDVSATGRMSGNCRGCHYDPYFALDKVAKILSKRVDTTPITFSAPTEGPQTVLDGKTISNDGELVSALLESTDYKFRTCRMAFVFLYGRPEASCESALFDKCIDAFTQTGDIRTALRTIAADPGYCE
ncbi:MAG TPA: hypothetical protein VMZ53_21500 [Kofleriaceae bacterium]|nr:hypothetical protein [Kofleriaceae bacterium]